MPKPNEIVESTKDGTAVVCIPLSHRIKVTDHKWKLIHQLVKQLSEYGVFETPEEQDTLDTFMSNYMKVTHEDESGKKGINAVILPKKLWEKCLEAQKSELTLLIEEFMDTKVASYIQMRNRIKTFVAETMKVNPAFSANPEDTAGAKENLLSRITLTYKWDAGTVEERRDRDKSAKSDRD